MARLYALVEFLECFGLLFVGVGLVVLLQGYRLTAVTLFSAAAVGLLMAGLLHRHLRASPRCPACGSALSGRPPTCPACGPRRAPL